MTAADDLRKITNTARARQIADVTKQAEDMAKKVVAACLEVASAGGNSLTYKEPLTPQAIDILTGREKLSMRDDGEGVTSCYVFIW